MRIVLAGVLLVAGCSRPASASPEPPVPVLVELFTSEGCSSCPPADAVLARLEKTQAVPGAVIVPIGMHVDYWDRLGWTDPFGSPAWSARQRAYAEAIGGGTYTPEAVVDGCRELVGSRAGALEQAIADAAKKPHAPVAIDVAPDPKRAAFDVTVTVGALPSGAARDAELVLAITRASAEVDVRRGENAGQKLAHTAIAKELRVLGAAPGTRTATIAAGPDLRVVAFVQERASRRVLGTATRGIVAAWPRP